MSQPLRDEDIVRVHDQVFLVTGSNTNWVIVKDGSDATLIDTGYPGDHARVLASLTAVGLEPQDVSAVLVTHAHTDHKAESNAFAPCTAPRVLMHEKEVPHARREFLYQVSVGQVLANAWRPGVVPWAVHAIRSGGTAHVPVTDPRPFPAPGPLDLPGAPVPVQTPGRPGGHCAYHLPDLGVLVSGDALVTAHPTSRIHGPQLLPGMFYSDREQAFAALSLLEPVDADVVLPGHGPLHRGTVKEAAVHTRP
ncbi:MBL fold metallo-hydrolase [Streptomyces mirabilis]|uniref:MBL fold metallo-hydrolase n=1 Tax=Streptomyces mirabilis TaxID=68239 RepID=UPI0022567597|nr:MBL fold metallo-hydrolase [Streptomyces mirabilis]MCX4432123.1 MBL fold metallo-hydrolase [Streptomyces mirabilis]